MNFFLSQQVVILIGVDEVIETTDEFLSFSARGN